MSYNINEKGYYGEFGGAYIPEMLYPNVEELRQNYLKIMAEPSFQEEFNALLKAASFELLAKPFKISFTDT